VIDKISPTGAISTIAGTEPPGYTSDGGPAIQAQLGIPSGLAADTFGNIYLADANGAVRILRPALLTVSATHGGNFVLSQNTAYTVTVTNAALAGPTSGTVTLTETIPAGLTLASMAGDGWNCAGNVCTRSDQLAGGASYPPVIVNVNVASDALPQVTNAVTVSGGGAPASSAEDATFVGYATPVLSISAAHAGIFTLGQTNATYSVVVANNAQGSPTASSVTVTETLPSALNLASMHGSGWNCTTNTCLRNDILPGGGAYPAITVAVNVVANAPEQVTNLVSLAGGGSAGATDVTILSSTTPVLAISATHTGTPMQGQSGVKYNLVVSNDAYTVATSGPVTVTETLPAGLTLVSMAGTGWDCTMLPTCTRSDVLASGASYLPITATVKVGSDVALQVTNHVSVAGGASAGASADDLTTISPFTCDVNGDGSVGVADIQAIVDEALGMAPAIHDLNQDGVVNLLDVQIVINAAMGSPCTAK
jgi:uncharacterized repeat protein (TIGR01451 family)